jgi:hypothetical protein
MRWFADRAINAADHPAKKDRNGRHREGWQFRQRQCGMKQL